MKLSNNPTRRLQRRKGALARFPVAPKEPDVSYIQGDRKVERVAVVVAAHAKHVDRWRIERERLVALCAIDENETRGIKTKKDHSSRAKLRFGDAP